MNALRTRTTCIRKPWLTLALWMAASGSDGAALADGLSWTEIGPSDRAGAPLAVSEAGKASAADPAGDTFGSGAARIDVTSFSAESTATELVLGLTFAGTVSAPDSGQPNALAGFIDLDVDRSGATGDRPFIDFLTDFETGMGDELHVALLTYSSEDGKADLVGDALDATVTRIPVSFSADALEVRIPSTFLGGGSVHAAAVVGTLAEATDAAPNGGFLSTTGPGGDGEVLLNGDRFRVEVAWRNATGAAGIGQLAVRSDDSAVLYFFDASNWELLVKVLDACGVNGNYWVFSAATTDVEFTLTVTDTQNGSVQKYSNPLGTAAAAVTDTGAFATCP